ncbi:MAG: protein-ADP-ribose hydrolase [Erysipelotrichaceae bacterium]|nr:protein-ADP-ribose hydrolase [Erysipelotrichaceae bacterium]
MKSQLERLDYLTEAFKQDSEEYKKLQTPADVKGKKALLRSLMNIRMPKDIDEEVLAIQDEYLKEANRQKGIVTLNEIPTLSELLHDKQRHSDVISIYQGDITCLAVDVIVNAANSQMLGCFIPMHNCIDNCIHTYAGIQLRAECDRQMKAKHIRYKEDYEQPTGIPLLTDGYNLPAKKVIHVVGPIVYDEVTPKLEEELASCYRNSLDMCAQNDLRSIAFCCISTGVFRFPKKEAALIAVSTVKKWLDENEGKIERVIFNVFSDEDRMIYEQIFRIY